MHSRAIFVLALCAFSAPAFAQEPPPPSPKLDAFKAMVGNWHGEGTAIPEEGMEEMPWTATIRFQPILGGYFFQEDTEIQVGAPTPLLMRTIYGWDAENERYVAYGTGNNAHSNFGTVHFPSDGTMVMGFTGIDQGRAVSARTVWKFGAGKMTFESERANDAGPFYTEVRGEFSKTDAAPKGAAEASFMNQPASGQMATLADRMAGSYDITGSMTMMPGAPAMEISGNETITTIFGGHVLLSIVEGHAGDMPPYVGHSYMTWNENDRCYDLVMFSNMGEAVKGQARFDGDDAIVTTFSGPMMGQLAAQRSVMKLGPNGVVEATSHAAIGTHDPFQGFHGKYVRKSD